ncbi:rod shape-determining protein MreC [Bacillus litorisediminis]|uniref:rod shape-determining protein MreC n=1 Tax=Bacillus litorisediminis TaxID=2922713 RepID=UPI001FAD6859|nr:rod shape-determining protein MreC [Bacillus litorisediminis]
MPQFFLNKRLMFLLVSIIILVALIGFSIRERSQLTWIEQFVKDTTGFVQNIVSKPVYAVAGLFEDVQALLHTYEENQLLKSKMEDYHQLDQRVKDLEQENEELRKTLGIEEDLRDFEPIQAMVIGRNPDQWHEIVELNKGAVNGVEDNMAVITADGLIGKIKSTSQFTSTVQLLSSLDPTNRISAIVQNEAEEVKGIIDGFDKEKKVLLLRDIPFDKKIEVGDPVVSSGLGGVFPSDLFIGEVLEVAPDQYGLTQMAYIKPAANLHSINHVIIVKRTATEPILSFTDEEAEEEEGS